MERVSTAILLRPIKDSWRNAPPKHLARHKSSISKTHSERENETDGEGDSK